MFEKTDKQHFIFYKHVNINLLFYSIKPIHIYISQMEEENSQEFDLQNAILSCFKPVNHNGH